MINCNCLYQSYLKFFVKYQIKKLGAVAQSGLAYVTLSKCVDKKKFHVAYVKVKVEMCNILENEEMSKVKSQNSDKSSPES